MFQLMSSLWKKSIQDENKIITESSDVTLGGSSGSEGSGSDSSSDDEDDDEESKKEKIVDATETNLISLRRTIYLTIQSALDFEEAVHKLLKLNIKPGQEMEMCHMIIDCCAQQRSVYKYNVCLL